MNTCKKGKHTGKLEIDEQMFEDWDEEVHGPMMTFENIDEYPENFMWSCCGKHLDSEEDDDEDSEDEDSEDEDSEDEKEDRKLDEESSTEDNKKDREDESDDDDDSKDEDGTDEDDESDEIQWTHMFSAGKLTILRNNRLYSSAKMSSNRAMAKYLVDMVSGLLSDEGGGVSAEEVPGVIVMAAGALSDLV